MKPKLLQYPFLALALASSAIAGQFIWTGASDSTWTDAANWDTTTTPPTTGGAELTYPAYGTDYTADNMRIANGAGAGAVYDPGSAVTTTFRQSRGIIIGGGAAADLTVSSGTIAVFNAGGAGQEPLMANGVSANLLINGGNIDLTGTSLRFFLVNNGATDLTSNMTITSGSFSCTALDFFNGTANGTSTINLDGGLLTLNRFFKTQGGTTSTLNLNGGTLRARNTNANFLLDLGGLQTVVKAGGAIIDTNGFDSTITEVLEHDSSLGATPDGGLSKIGAGILTLTGANTYTGGTTNNDGGSIRPNNDSALGTGAVVSNGGTIYPTATTTFANSLTLNNASLRIGGSGSKTITWNGPVTVTGTSGLAADGGTGGVTLTNTVDIAGATLTSFASATNNNIDGVISGAGGNVTVTGGGLQLSGTNTYTGTSTLESSGILRLQATGTISSSSNVVINTGGNFNIRTTGGWVYGGSISGDGTGQINLNDGTNATLAGNISGVSVINVNSAGTDVTISGDISGAANVNVQNTGGAILRLGGANSYNGNTTINDTGTLVLAANNVLPDDTNVTIGSGTLDAATFTDTAGTLDPSGSATINLGSGATLAFADSSGVDWTGGALDITGTFVSGTSLRFGTGSGGLTSTQLDLITVNGGGAGTFSLDASGFLIQSAASGFDAWKTANSATGGINDDHDDDGVSNGVEYFIGGPSGNTTGFTPLPGVANTSGTLSVTFTKAADYTGVYGTDFAVETSETLAAGSWTTAAQGTGADLVEITGNSVKYTFPAGTKKFARLRVTGP